MNINVQNKSIIYRPGIYNLQTRTVTFPDQEKLRQKVDLRYLKTLKPKKLETTTPTIMWWHTDVICTIYRPEKTAN